jgi:hypothetical protein
VSPSTAAYYRGGWAGPSPQLIRLTASLSSVGAVKVDEIVDRLSGRKAVTEADIQSDVRALLLYGGLDLAEKDLIVLEAQAGGGRRIDVETGGAVIEVKKDLSNSDVHRKAAEQLAGYLQTRTNETGQRYAGILTDGVFWELHHLTSEGLKPVNSLHLHGEGGDSAALTTWLEGVLATGHNISPTPTEIQRRLGAKGSSFALDYADLREVYAEHRDDSEVAVKRELWGRLLASALGTHFPNTDELFVLHTYLVVSAELIAHAAIGLPIIGQPPRALLSGEVFRSHDVGGVVEADFFDWPADTEKGRRFVASLARRIARFDWSDVNHDVLKALYESVIDAQTRKQLGEYYTPDWLAEGMVAAAVKDPLQDRVLDPACGSGTFLFWAIKRYLAAADSAGVPNEDAIEGLVSHVAGIDLHPVAVALARVTYLLAIGTKRLQPPRPRFSVPVYLGDSIRWKKQDEDETLLSRGGLKIDTTSDAQLFNSELYFPERVVADAGRFDRLVAELAESATKRERHSPVPNIGATLNRLAIHPDDRADVVASFQTLCDLHDQRSDHIWGYYVRNQARPFWFTQPDNQVDVLVGNPPWLAYRFMPKEMQRLYRALSEQRSLWAGGKVSTHQDLSDLFVVRSIEQYLTSGGRFAFVVPAAVLSRRQFEGFRHATYQAPGTNTTVEFGTPWDLRSVAPDIFPVPSAVVFGERAPTPVPLPETARAFSGRIAPRGTRWNDAEAALVSASAGVQRGADNGIVSEYASRFYQGAIILPRVLLTVREVPSGPLGTPTGMRRVGSVRSPLEKPPWKGVPSLEGPVEEQFVRQTYFGATIAPFRVLDDPALSVIPWTGSDLLDSHDARLDEFPGLAEWWRKAEDIWQKNRSGTTLLSLKEQLDYYGKLSGQFPVQPMRVVYTKSGNRITACRVDNTQAIVDHTLYWGAVESVEEGRYLVAILNSDAVHQKVEPLMSEGLFGKRHVDKYVFAVPFPVFDPGSESHLSLSQLSARAEHLAAGIELPDGIGFQKARRLVRETLAADGVRGEIEALVAELLAPVPVPA